MGFRELLGLNGKKEDAEKATDATGKQSSQPRQDKIPASVQDSCCGSCGGGHTEKKGYRG
jgi:hypothetical protein